ncbi:MobA/MobL family protein [Mesorhizobium sp. M0478]|uniref:MobA/MobL family protein n=1 Tax=Mesorhizobium sp. M0478 TaxID=2956947 RepID=UPI0033358C29
MAIYSLNHRPIGKTTQSQPYTASSHVGYITRESAEPQVEAARMPDSKTGAQEFFRRVEDTSRANARVGDKLMLALPRELSPEQRMTLVRGFAEDVTKGRAPWFAALHDNGAEAHNPHCHLIFHDRDKKTGRRVFGTSEAGSTQRLRALWEVHANNALEAAEKSERVDRRTLEAQGIHRAAPIHEGPKSQAARRRGVRPRSRARNARNGRGARSRFREVDYPRIDQGRTRAEFNRALAVGAESNHDYWQAVDADRVSREMDALRAIHRPDLVDGGGKVVGKGKLGRRLKSADTIGLSNLKPDFTMLGGAKLDPSGRPNLVPSLDLRVAPLAPATERSNHKQQPAQNVDERFKSGGDSVNHNATSGYIMGQAEGKAMDVDVKNILARHAKDIEQAEYEKNKADTALAGLMKASFKDKDKAQEKMDRYERRHGRPALADMLENRFENNKVVRAKKPGSLFTLDGYKHDGPAKRNNADAARRQLPNALRAADAAKAKLGQAKDTHRDARNRYGLPAEAPSGSPTGQTPGQVGSGGPKDVSGKQQKAEPSRQQQPSAQQAAPSVQQHQPPSQRPPRFSEVSRARPAEPVAFRPGDKPRPELAAGFKPKQQGPAGPRDGKPSSFTDKVRSAQPTPKPSGSFSEKLADMRSRPSEKPKLGQDKGKRPGRDREDERER